MDMWWTHNSGTDGIRAGLNCLKPIVTFSIGELNTVLRVRCMPSLDIAVESKMLHRPFAFASTSDNIFVENRSTNIAR